MQATTTDILIRAWQIAKPRYAQPENSIAQAIHDAAAEFGAQGSAAELGALRLCEEVCARILGAERAAGVDDLLDWWSFRRPGRSSHDAEFVIAEAAQLARWATEPDDDRLECLGDLRAPWKPGPRIVSIRSFERAERQLPCLPGLNLTPRVQPGGTYTVVEVANLGRYSRGIQPTHITELEYGPDNPFPATRAELWERIWAAHDQDLANERAGD